jgi:hypothetical protein
MVIVPGNGRNVGFMPNEFIGIHCSHSPAYPNLPTEGPLELRMVLYQVPHAGLLNVKQGM